MYWVPCHRKGNLLASKIEHTRFTERTLTINPQLTFPYFIGKDKEGLYLTVPFTMPANVESFSLSYEYEYRPQIPVAVDNGKFTSTPEVNVIDLGLIDPAGKQVGASGSDKRKITISETDATPGYHPWPLTPGEWKIIVGAYHVAPQGVNITYHLNYTFKHLHLLKGDLHTHTLASDGVLTAEELTQRALRHGLDFLAITDHNQMVTADALPHLPGITVIPGVEYTLFKAHANFIGSEQPYDEAFLTNDMAGIIAHYQSARERGALITINHPFEEICPFTIDLKIVPFDCIEIWNGPMRESNLRAVGLWHNLLVQGMKVPISAGSDFHRDSLFLFPGGPTICVLTMSASPADILAAVKQGHAYVIYAPDGPTLDCTAADAKLGDSVPFSKVKEMKIAVTGLVPGDLVQVVTAQGAEPLVKASVPGYWEGNYLIDVPGFARVEILRAFLPGLPLLPALISNPIYFDK